MRICKNDDFLVQLVGVTTIQNIPSLITTVIPRRNNFFNGEGIPLLI